MSPLRRAIRYTVRVIKGAAIGHFFLEYVFDIRATYGPSMLPTIDIQDDWIIMSKLHVRGRGVKVGDVVSYRVPILPGKSAIKRVIGMPGDFVLTGTPGSGGSDQMIQVPEGHCWLVGDNLGCSRDSRLLGPVPLALIKGKVLLKFSRSSWVESWVTSLGNGLRKPEGDI